MDDSKREAYEKWIDRLRKCVAWGMGGCLVLAFFEPPMVYIAAIGGLACALLAFLLVVEYLVRVLLTRSGRTLPWYQFSLAGMLILTACIAAVCAWLKILGPLGIVWLIFGLVIFACLLEWWMRKKK